MAWLSGGMTCATSWWKLGWRTSQWSSSSVTHRYRANTVFFSTLFTTFFMSLIHTRHHWKECVSLWGSAQTFWNLVFLQIKEKLWCKAFWWLEIEQVCIYIYILANKWDKNTENKQLLHNLSHLISIRACEEKECKVIFKFSVNHRSCSDADFFRPAVPSACLHYGSLWIITEHNLRSNLPSRPVQDYFLFLIIMVK